MTSNAAAAAGVPRRPMNWRWVIWGSYALVLIVAPLLWRSSLAHTMLSQMGVAIVACLAYNMLLGQGGMLSFGHAVYSGLGSFFAIHALNMVSGGQLALPVSLVPLVGGLAGMLVAVLLGYVTTKKAGTPFAMITLGIGELVFAMSLMFPGFFGGFASTAGSPREKELASMALTVVKTDGDGDLRGKALAYLASRRSPDTAELLLALLPKQSPAIRGQIFDALLSRPERVAALLDAVEQGRIKARELDQTRATRLLKNVTKDSKARAEKLLASAMPADRTKALEQYKPALSLKADAVRGKEVFKKNCATCHKIGDVGIEVGPSIADLRTKTLEQVLVDVLQPNKAIDNNFISYTVVTDDGLQYVGIVVADTPGSVTLKMPDGKTVSVLKTEIDEMSSNGVSLMPEGLERNIPPQEMADVISFVKNWRYLDGAVPDAPGAPKGVQSN